MWHLSHVPHTHTHTRAYGRVKSEEAESQVNKWIYSIFTFDYGLFKPLRYGGIIPFLFRDPCSGVAFRANQLHTGGGDGENVHTNGLPIRNGADQAAGGKNDC